MQESIAFICEDEAPQEDLSLIFHQHHRCLLNQSELQVRPTRDLSSMLHLFLPTLTPPTAAARALASVFLSP
jgi:hypothetical protein